MPKMRKSNDLVPEEESFDDWDSPSNQTMGHDSNNFEELLKADQVAAVRFHKAKPGYSFTQVEIFVDQVKHTLAVLEQELYEKDLVAHELRREQEELQDRVLELQATIEVFRAKGDPMVNADGSYVRESQLQDTARYTELEAEMESLQKEVDNLQEENRVLTEKMESLAESLPESDNTDLIIQEKEILLAEREALLQEIALLKEEVAEANAAEEEMREYVEVTLASWLASQQQNEPAQESVSTDTFAEVTVEEETFEAVPVTEDEEETYEDYTDDEGWGEDAPVIHESVEGAEEISLEEDAILEEEPKEGEDGTTPAVDRTNILVSAPELEGGIDLSSLPMPSGSPIPGLPEPPKRKKAPLTDAPELKS